VAVERLADAEQMPLKPEDCELIDAAEEALSQAAGSPRHTVASAVLCASGIVHTAVNTVGCIYSECSGMRAVASAFVKGDRDIVALVTVDQPGGRCRVVAPGSECQELLAEDAPSAMVIMSHGGGLLKMRALDLWRGRRPEGRGT
jgi:cytidine deaminase